MKQSLRIPYKKFKGILEFLRKILEFPNLKFRIPKINLEFLEIASLHPSMTKILKFHAFGTKIAYIPKIQAKNPKG